MTTATVLDTFTAIEQRRSVKHYDPQYTIPQAEVDKLMSLTLLSPTSFNIQNWRLVCVQDQAVKEQLYAAAWNQDQVKDASFVVIFCADLKAAEKNPERYWRNAPQAVQDFLVPMILKYYKDQPELQTAEAHRSCGIASQTLMLAAKAMGYDTCPMVGYDPQQVAQIINLPADHVISLMVVVGKATQPARERGGQLDYNDVVIQNRFA